MVLAIDLASPIVGTWESTEIDEMFISFTSGIRHVDDV